MGEVTPPSHAHLVYVDKDLPRIARYEVADEPKLNGKRFVLTHELQADLGEAEPLKEIDWVALEAFRLAPPQQWAVTPPETTPPQVA